MKIKKYLKRLLVVLPCISVLLLSFAFPVSAVSGSDWFSLNPSWQTLYGSGTYAQLSANGNYLGEYPPYEWYGSSGVSYNLSNGVPAGSWELHYEGNEC